MYTPFSKKNSSFSNEAHKAAQRLIYPAMFGVPLSNLSFEDTLLELNERGRALDGELATDRIVKVTATVQGERGFREPISFTIQERFRRPKYARYKDLTITEWNNRSGHRSELYKLAANFFVYGYFDDKKTVFVDAIAVNVPAMLSKLCNGRLSYGWRSNPRSGQDFITLTFSALEKSGCVMYRQEKTGGH